MIYPLRSHPKRLGPEPSDDQLDHSNVNNCFTGLRGAMAGFAHTRHRFLFHDVWSVTQRFGANSKSPTAVCGAMSIDHCQLIQAQLPTARCAMSAQITLQHFAASCSEIRPADPRLCPECPPNVPAPLRANVTRPPTHDARG